MNARYLAAAAALALGAAVLFLVEPMLLGGPFGEHRGRWRAMLLQQAPVVCGWAAVWCLGTGLGLLPRLRPSRRHLEALRRLLVRGVPVADARAVAVFRVVFAAGLLHVLRVHEIHEPAVETITPIAVVLFGAGLFTRPALVTATAGTWLWMLAWTEHFGTHPISVLLVALPALWPARWADEWSVDAWLWRRPRQPASRTYGYALWMPCFVLGVVLFAAAAAKIASPAWIANGTVKFAFVADYHRASVPWGLWIASHPPAAVAASAGAVAIEALAITAAFARSWVYRLSVGVLVSLLFAGFYLLQGELWRAWWLLITAFLPWELLSRSPRESGGPASLARAQWTAVAALVAVQAIASAARLEIRPAISAYDMYSATFDSTAAFDRENPMLDYRFEAESASGEWVDVTECFDPPRSREIAAAWALDTAPLRGSLGGCEHPVPPDPRRLRLVESLRVFDWGTGRFSWKYRDRERWTVPLAAAD